jgi:pyruvate kinase
MDYEIIATLGPASSTVDLWEAMLAAGVTAFRLNTSHLSLPQIDEWLQKLTSFRSNKGNIIRIILDLQGSKWRVGEFEPFTLIDGEEIELCFSTSMNQPGVIPVPHRDFFSAANVSSSEIVLNDARLRLIKECSGADWIKARVVLGGLLSPHKGITYTASEFRTENISEKDQAIIRRTQSITRIRYAVSYIKDAQEMQNYREILGPEVDLIAKLERQPAISEAIQIAEYCNEVWLCRGDMGAELGIPGMAEAVYRFGLALTGIPVPCLLAGQVLEHMTVSATPTRSEVCYLYEALHKGFRGVVLSDEAAVGRFPVEACQAAAIFRN